MSDKLEFSGIVLAAEMGDSLNPSGAVSCSIAVQ